MIFIPLAGLKWRNWRHTQKFGENPHIYRIFDLDAHNGQDFAPLIPGTRGVKVYAPHDGYVTIGDEGGDGYGKYVRIISNYYNKEKDRRCSYLAHLDSFLVKPKQFVYAGDPIGIMGNTGFSTGIHLHFTYKKMSGKKAKVLNYSNGYHGAIDVSSYILPLLLRPLSR